MVTYDAVSDFIEAKTDVRSPITSFDTGYEHSLEHMIDVQRLVDEADPEPRVTAWLHALGIEY